MPPLPLPSEPHGEGECANPKPTTTVDQSGKVVSEKHDACGYTATRTDPPRSGGTR